MNDSFLSKIEVAIRREAGLEEIAELLRDCRDAGLPQRDVCSALEDLRYRVGPAMEDRVLEALDVATGFCPPHLRVWNK